MFHIVTVFVRGPNDEDLSCFVSKIVFSLHPSFDVPIRGKLWFSSLQNMCSLSVRCCPEITSPPFEVTEMGWGEFEAGIRIFFKDPDEKVRDTCYIIEF